MALIVRKSGKISVLNMFIFINIRTIIFRDMRLNPCCEEAFGLFLTQIWSKSLQLFLYKNLKPII